MTSGKQRSVSKIRFRLQGIVWLLIYALSVWAIAAVLPSGPPPPRTLLVVQAQDGVIEVYESFQWNRVLSIIRRGRGRVDPARRTMETADGQRLAIPAESTVLIDAAGAVRVLPLPLPQGLVRELLLTPPRPTETLAEWAASRPQAGVALSTVPELEAFWNNR